MKKKCIFDYGSWKVTQQKIFQFRIFFLIGLNCIKWIEFVQLNLLCDTTYDNMYTQEIVEQQACTLKSWKWSIALLNLRKSFHVVFIGDDYEII